MALAHKASLFQGNKKKIVKGRFFFQSILEVRGHDKSSAGITISSFPFI